MPLQAVTFDFHDTLVDCDEWFQLEIRDLVPALLSWAADREVIPDAHARRSEAITRYRVIRSEVIESGIERDAVSCALRVLEEMKIDIPEHAVACGVNDLMRAALRSASPHEGAVESVEILATWGITLGVISSAAHHGFLEWSLAEYGLLDQFSAIVTSADSGHYKSTPRIYEYALRVLGAEASRSVHVGDSLLYDVASASRVGMHTVWLNRGGGVPDGIAPDLTVTTLVGLAPRILSAFAE
jgi:putative hydrolase of the HAD superfamily